MRPFLFSVEKTVQAIGVLLQTLGREQLEYVSLLKMLYIVDRESVRDRGRPVTGDVAVAMSNGPVLSGVYDFIRLDVSHLHRSLPFWTKYLWKDEYDLVLNEDPGTDQLSPYEIRKLQEVARAHEGHGWRDMVRITHELPEWQKNNPAKFGLSMKPIPLEDIFEAVGRADHMEALLEDADVATACQQLLRR